MSFWSGNAAAFLAADDDVLVGELARQQMRRFSDAGAEQEIVWRDRIAVLKAALRATALDSVATIIALEYSLVRLNTRIDAVLLTDRAILVLEFKRGSATPADLRQVEDYALDLLDFHAGSRAHPIVPILVSGGAERARNDRPLFLHGVTSVWQTPPDELGPLLRDLSRALPAPCTPLDGRAWLTAAYRPVPTIVEAARIAYARNGVADIATARADATNLRGTTEAIHALLAEAASRGEKIALFVTGIPGAGKTLCGLGVAFGGRHDATFLTGNPTLVHVLREALARDAKAQGANPRMTDQKLSSAIQRLPDFRTDHLSDASRVPPEQVVVIDEAQRCWSADHARRKTRDKPVVLTDSEPGHLLDIMDRRPGFAAYVCLVGGGQEIHDGEGGLAEWGTALRARPHWHAAAPPDALADADPRRRLGPLDALVVEPLLHLTVAVRQVRNGRTADWVEALLAADMAEARRLAAQDPPLPMLLTRDLAAAREAARLLARGTRRAGLLASSGARRLRAAGLGAELPHMDAGAVARWFLDHYPDDVRASDALETIATEFSAQGLELDVALLCWDLDLRREPGRAGWVPWRFAGRDWQRVRGVEAAANQLNTYRVLLTRARYETILFVPRGDAIDRTRDPTAYDAIADFVASCGVRPLASLTLPESPATISAPPRQPAFAL